MWRFFQIAWRITWGLIEVAIVFSVLITIKNNDTALIISALGLIYATIRSISLINGMAALRVAAAYELKFYELRRLVHDLATMQASLANDLWALELKDEKIERPDVEALVNKAFVDWSIAGVFVCLIYLICLYQFFSRLS
jgi:hypothetical protein